ncbi:hypothetical protein XI07_31220 [Bradyrhizobium sp. CCBAU 11445]|nr:hypothetical protein [Bradyrhizobium sp. CCBAU 11445]
MIFTLSQRYVELHPLRRLDTSSDRRLYQIAHTARADTRWMAWMHLIRSVRCSQRLRLAPYVANICHAMRRSYTAFVRFPALCS